LALLDAMDAADVWLCMHAGLERAGSFGDLWRGELIGRRIVVEIRRLGRDSVPDGAEARRAWLDRLWREVDEFVAANEALPCRGDGC
jgi:hypothetical protein